MSCDYGPTHIIVIAGAKATRCGRTGKERFPLVLAEYVQAHIDGYGMTVCPECSGIPNPDPPKIDGQLDLFGGVA